jgi:hypothetical protein
MLLFGGSVTQGLFDLSFGDGFIWDWDPLSDSPAIGSYGDLWSYNFTTNSWTYLNSGKICFIIVNTSATNVSGFASATFGNKIYNFGGFVYVYSDGEWEISAIITVSIL